MSIKLLRENWLHGIGFQKFRVEFNEQQAAYFSNRSLDDNISLLADNTFYAFNDILQWIIETGIVGFLIFVLFLFILELWIESSYLLLSSLLSYRRLKRRIVYLSTL